MLQRSNQSCSILPYKERAISLLVSLGLVACGGGSSDTPASTSTGSSNGGGTGGTTCSVSQLETDMTNQLGQLSTDADFSFAVERDDGRRYAYNRGTSSMSTSYESASTSKMVSAMIILRLVEKGYLKLEDKPQDWISNWPMPLNSPLRNMTLANLLSFTSGLTEESTCINVGISNFESCVASIANVNQNNTAQPGTEFYYSSSHSQVAGLMAIKARGVSSWQELFSEFKQQTGLFKSAAYDLPSLSNPRLAGGMHWNGTEYLDFLSALKAGKLLTPAMQNLYLQDRTANVKLTYSPAAALNEVWHYGFGYWHECQSSSFNCMPASRISSPGAYGAYPYWDRNKSYVGIIARQGALGTFPKGVDIERAIRPKVEAWVACK
ncbi:serine hydrolase domain-containing protein [Undibacterium cyanobacteriorum]|uniref:Serine hydrolase domain-containing protein n=1 Tax=Undibacterium cyanobacteriorum TaxID=3073561 RepID=A0ABY9RJW3_9BURK|nr:serine hydrolase domain-containing protein [Undibacterium sp. 20NA77.5]WMW81515.1 serine hydrolase domain-containing protein [Undibacterium sp. 20NA77.5]